MNKESTYREVLLVIESIWDEAIAWEGNLANVCAVLKSRFGFWWVGFYVVRYKELQLSVFQGPSACTRIAKGRGVCGTSWKNAQTIVVPNVHEFEGHIACSSASNSEIVVPIFHPKGEVWGVLDIDSELLNHFDSMDKVYLDQLADFISKKLS